MMSILEIKTLKQDVKNFTHNNNNKVIMKLHYIALAAGMTFFSACTQNQKKEKPTTDNVSSRELANKMDSLNYAFGVDVGNSLKSSGMEGINPQLIQEGIAEVLDSNASEL